MLILLSAAGRVLRFSPEFCIPDDGRGGCSGIQYAMGLFRRTDDTITISCGVDDCSSAMVDLQLPYLRSLLSWGDDSH
eukprot:3535763-Prymnesium_polylepis.2